jgi:hypothetical protein
VGCDVDVLAGADADEDEDEDADVDVLAGADAVVLAGVDTDEDEDADAAAGALSPTTGTNGSCGVICRMASKRFAGADVAVTVGAWSAVAAGVLVAGVVTDGEAVLDDEPELFSSFGNWKTSTAANKASSPTRMSFLRRSAALRAATRRLGMCVFRALMSE